MEKLSPLRSRIFSIYFSVLRKYFLYYNSYYFYDYIKLLQSYCTYRYSKRFKDINAKKHNRSCCQIDGTQHKYVGDKMITYYHEENVFIYVVAITLKASTENDSLPTDYSGINESNISGFKKDFSNNLMFPLDTTVCLWI